MGATQRVRTFSSNVPTRVNDIRGITSVGRDVEKKEPSYAIGRNVN